MKEYRNVIRTKKQIRNAFCELLDEKHDINKITVKELVDRADISKSTFYAHYLDIYNLAEEFENEIFDLLEEIFNELKLNNDYNFNNYINKVIAFLKENERLYKVIVNSAFPMNFIDKLKKMCNEAIENDAKFEFLSPEPKLRKTQIDFITNGTIYLCIDYFKGNLSQSLDEIGLSVLAAMNTMFKIKMSIKK